MKILLWLFLALAVLAAGRWIMARTPGGDGVMARLDLGPAGGQFMLTQKWNNEWFEQYEIIYWYKPPSKTQWLHFSLEANAPRWFRAKSEFDPATNTVYLKRGRHVVLEYQLGEEFLYEHEPDAPEHMPKKYFAAWGNYYQPSFSF